MMKYTNGTKWTLAITAGLALGSLALPTRAANVFWQGPGPDHNGGSGLWDVAGNWNGGIPTGSDEVYIDGDNTAGQSLTTITIDDTDAATNSLRARKGKNVTIAMGAGSSLTGGWLRVGSNSTSQRGVTMTFQGPAADEDAASVSMDRIYTQDHANTTTNHLAFAGNLNVTLRTTADNTLYNDSTLTITDGASVTANSLLAYAQTGPVRVSIDNGHLTATRLYSNFAGSVVQMTADSTLTITNSYGLRILNGGRFEGEGAGLDSGGSRIYTGSTLAVGVTDPTTQTRTSAATLTLSDIMKMQDDSTLEMGVFGPSGDNDQFLVAQDGSVSADASENTSILKLVAYGYTPQLGDTYTLIKDTGGYISPNLVFDQFDLPTLSAGHWDTTAFNIDGGWQISVVPEPAALGLLLVGGLSSLCRRRRVQ